MSAIEKLATGDMFPQLKLKAAGGKDFVLPDDINADYDRRQRRENLRSSSSA